MSFQWQITLLFTAHLALMEQATNISRSVHFIVFSSCFSCSNYAEKCNWWRFYLSSRNHHLILVPEGYSIYASGAVEADWWQVRQKVIHNTHERNTMRMSMSLARTWVSGILSHFVAARDERRWASVGILFQCLCVGFGLGTSSNSCLYQCIWCHSRVPSLPGVLRRMVFWLGMWVLTV